MKTIKILALIILNLLIFGFVYEFKTTLQEYKIIILLLIIGLSIISFYATRKIIKEDTKAIKSMI